MSKIFYIKGWPSILRKPAIVLFPITLVVLFVLFITLSIIMAAAVILELVVDDLWNGNEVKVQKDHVNE